MPTTPPPEKNIQAAVALLKQLQLVVNSSTFNDFHAIVADNEKLKSENERFKVTQEENCMLLTQKQNELNAKKEEALRHRAELDTARNGTESVRKELEASGESVRRELEASKKRVAELETELEGTSSNTTNLMMTIRRGQSEAAHWREKATEHENSRVQADAAALKAVQELNATKKDLGSTNSRLETLEKYGHRFKEPEWNEVTRSLQSLFKKAYSFVNAYFNIDFDERIIANPEAWSQLSNHKSILRVLPLPRSNSASAKLMRVAAVLCVLATSLIENLFQPTYLLVESNELADLLDELLQTDTAQERHLRAQMLCFDPEQQKSNGQSRAGDVVVDVFSIVSDLLLPAQQPAFHNGLEKLCESALGAWVPIQRLGPRVEPTLDVGSSDLWRQLPAEPAAPAASPRVARADTKLVVWPSFLVVELTEMSTLCEGLVVAESQVQGAAREKVAESLPERRRSARHRSRANTNRALAAGKPFLSSGSGKQSGGG